MVTAITKSQIFLSASLEGPSLPDTKCRCGIARSNRSIPAPPSKIPTTAIRAGRHPAPYRASETSRLGMMSEKNEAASITPAANPNRTSCALTVTPRPSNTGMAPSAVIIPVARLPKIPAISGVMNRRHKSADTSSWNWKTTSDLSSMDQEGECWRQNRIIAWCKMRSAVSMCRDRRDYLDFVTLIFFLFSTTSGGLVTVTVSTPSLTSAATSSASISNGSATVRWNAPDIRSIR